MPPAVLQPTILLVHPNQVARQQLRTQIQRLGPHALVLEAPTDALALDLVHLHCQLTQVPRSLLVLLDAASAGRQQPPFLVALTQLSTVCYETLTVVACTMGSEATAAELSWVRARAVILATPLTSEVLHQLLLRYLPAARG